MILIEDIMNAKVVQGKYVLKNIFLKMLSDEK